MVSDRKQYTAEFKRDFVRLMTEGKQSLSEVSRTLGVNVSLLDKQRRPAVALECRGFMPYFECFAPRLLGLAATTKATIKRGWAGQATGGMLFAFADSCSAPQGSLSLRESPPKGHPVQDERRDQGIRIRRKRVARLMREEGLVGRSRARHRVQTTNSRHSYRVADNLLERRFAPQEVARLNRFWCDDMTYLPPAQGWVYLATVKDIFSRRILGWALDDSLEATLVAAAWQRALRTRGFAACQGPILYPSDRGSQYCGTLFRDLRRCSGTQASIRGKGECLDNAAAESFFGTLKAELLADQPETRFADKTQAARLIGDYIDNFYNSIRRHAALGNKCPISF